MADDVEEASDDYFKGPFEPPVETALGDLNEKFTRNWATFSANPPEPLWHYTGIDGFHAMISNGTIRFSHTRLLNDTTEGALGWSRVTEELDAEIQSQVHLSEFYNMTKVVASDVHKDYHYFVFCLSERDDSLSQWRAYGRGGSGFSLGFAPAPLTQKRADGDFSLVKLIYDEQRFRNIIRAGIKSTRRFFQTMNRFNVPKQHRLGVIHRANVILSLYLMRVSLLCKDASFEDEREWRIVVGYSHRGGPTDMKMLKGVAFWPDRALPRPHFDFDFKYEGQAPDLFLPLRVVRYGPTLRAAGTELSLRFFLEQKGYLNKVTLKPSAVPLEA